MTDVVAAGMNKALAQKTLVGAVLLGAALAYMQVKFI